MTERTLKIAYITAGAAQMFCGSCLRDNALAAALSRLGCDIQLIPVYTPIRTDDEDVSIDKLFFGGINVYLQQKIPLFRYLPRFVDRPLDHPWLVRKLSALKIETEGSRLGELTLSMLKGENGFQRKEIRRLVEWLKREVRPDLVNLPNILLAGCAPAIKRELRIPVLATLQGEDLFLESLVEPFRAQALNEVRKLARQLDGLLVFSRYYTEFMSEYLETPMERFRLVPLGLNLEGFQTQNGRASPDRPRTIGYFARICPEKGFHVLVEAFLELLRISPDQEIRLRAGGWLGESDRSFFGRQLKRLEKRGAHRAFEYAGAPDRAGKIEFLRKLDVFSVPTVYREPKGLFVLEALASGVPVVQPAHGIFPELIEATGGGLLTRPEDPAHLAETWHHLLSDTEGRKRLAQTGRRRVFESFSADTMARRTLEVYKEFL